MLFCGDYKDVFMTAIAIISLSTSDTMLCSKKSIIKSCQEGTFIWKKKKIELKCEREFDQCKDPVSVQMIRMNLEIIVATNIGDLIKFLSKQAL